MNRRNFLRGMVPMTMAPLALSGIPIQVLADTALAQSFSCDEVADRALVLIQLVGGNDGLNTLIPINQYQSYKNYRPKIAISDTGTNGYTNLDTTLSIHDQVGIQPDMLGLKELYDDGKVNFIQDVCYADNNKSHFKGADIWLSGADLSTSAQITSGWVGRYLDHRFPGFPDGFPNADMPDPLGIQLGSKAMSLGFYREAGIATGMAIGGDPIKYLNLISGVGGTLPGANLNSHYGKELDFINQIELGANTYAQRLADLYNVGTNTVTYPETYHSSGGWDNELSPQLQVIARLLSGGSKTKIFLVKLSGFDNHANMVSGGNSSTGNHAVLLYHLSQALKAFQADLKGLGLEDRVLTATFSEFGRTVLENGNLGTDHGTSAPMMLIGKGVNPGVTGTNPDLSKVQQNNFTNFQHDYRRVFTTLLQDWMGAGPVALAASEMDTFSNQKLNLINTNYINNLGESISFVADPGCYDETPGSFPVEFLGFEVEASSGHRVNCSWVTASEKDNQGFFIERSADKVIFESIGNVPGAGNSSSIEEYEFIDESPLAGKSYYRIRQVDIDGSTQYSEVKSITLDFSLEDVSCSFYPNPVVDTLKIQCQSSANAKAWIRVMKLNGGTLYKEAVDLKMGENHFSVPVSSYSPGVYFVELYSISKGSPIRHGWSKIMKEL